MNSNHPSSSAGTRGGSAADSTSAARNSKRPKCMSSLLLFLLVIFSYPKSHSPTPRVFYFGCFHLLLFSDSFRNTWVGSLCVLNTLIFLFSCISGFLGSIRFVCYDTNAANHVGVITSTIFSQFWPSPSTFAWCWVSFDHAFVSYLLGLFDLSFFFSWATRELST